MHCLNKKASHFHQSTLVQYLRVSNLDKGASFSPTVSEIISSLHSRDLSVLVLNRHLKTADNVGTGPADFEAALLHHVEGSKVTITATDDH